MKTSYIIKGLMGVALLAAPLAEANSISLEVIANGSTVYDVTATGVASGGTLSYSATVGSWNIVVNTFTYPFPTFGTLASPDLDTSTMDAYSSTGGTLEIIFSGNDYTQIGTGVLTVGGTADNMTGIYTAYYDSGNTLGAETTLIGSTTAITGGSAQGNVGAEPNSLTQDILLTAGAGGGHASLDAELTVPDGGLTITLLGGALLGLRMFRRRLVC
ncbi:MAG: hypothetical protein ABSG04_05175 [Verrucomicrobiota bacterium]